MAAPIYIATNSARGFPFLHTLSSIFFLIYLFTYFWLHWVSAATHGPLSSCGERGPFVVVHRLLTVAASPAAEHGLQAHGPQYLWLAGSRAQAQQLWPTGSRAQAQQLWCTGPAAPRHAESSRTRAQTPVPCTGRQTPNHRTTREVRIFFLNLFIFGCVGSSLW